MLIYVYIFAICSFVYFVYILPFISENSMAEAVAFRLYVFDRAETYPERRGLRRGANITINH